MNVDAFGTAALVVLGIAPGVYALWSSRKILSRIDDPLLPDLVLAHHRRIGSAAGAALGIGMLFARGALAPFLLLIFLSALAGGFPARRRIFDESWSLPAYLGHSLRFWIGVLGAVLIVAMVPSAMALASGNGAIAVGAGLGLLATLLTAESSLWCRSLLRAKPLQSPELEARFSRILERASCAAPLLLEAEARGGSWCNAFAVPSLRRSSVLLTRGLLSALTPAEATAIFAHEIAHLEHYTRRKLLLGCALMPVLAAIPVFLWGGPFASALHGMEWLWPIAFLVALRFRMSRQREHETASDLRAVALSGDPEALVSALTKLHTLHRVSRRWDAAHESHSTHPSLARRIQAIRASASSGPVEAEPGPAESLFHSSDEPGTSVLFDREKLHWLRGVPEDGREVLSRSQERRSLPYGELRELRLAVSFDATHLVFTDSAGRTIRMRVRSEDVPPLQDLLDKVDVRLDYGSRSAAEPSLSGRVWSLCLLVLGIIPSLSWTLVVLGVLGAVRPAGATLLALGVAGLAWAGWGALRPAPFPDTANWAHASVVSLCAVACLVLAWRRRQMGIRDARTDFMLAALLPLATALASAVSAAGALLSSLPAMQLHLWARTHAGFAIGVLASAAVLAARSRAAVRVAAPAAALLAAFAAAFVFVGSLAFRERFTDDLFASRGKLLAIEDRSFTRIREVTVPGGVSRLVLSPAGSHFAAAVVAPGEEYRESVSSEIFVETVPGKVESIRAVAFDFLDEERILVLVQEESRHLLQVMTLSDLSSGATEQEIPLLARVEVDADQETDGWRVTGTAWGRNELVVLEGKLGESKRDEIRVSLEGEVGSLVQVNRDGWALARTYLMPDTGRWAGSVPIGPLYLLASSLGIVIELKLQKPSEPEVTLGKSALGLQCFDGAAAENRFFCLASDPETAVLWSLDPRSNSWRSLGYLEGVFYGDESSRGAQLALTGARTDSRLLHLAEGTAIGVPPEVEGVSSNAWGLLAWRNDVLARASVGESGSETTVTLYRIQP